MGQHKQNPMARGSNYAGPVPEAVLGCEVISTIQPSKKFLEMVQPLLDEAKAAGMPEPAVQFTDDDKDVVFILRGIWAVPMRTTLMAGNGMPAAKIEIAELARIPLLEFKQRVASAFQKENPALVGTLGLGEKAPGPSLVE